MQQHNTQPIMDTEHPEDPENAKPKPKVGVSTLTLLDVPATPATEEQLESTRTYSGRNPVPTIESLWEVVPDSLNPLSSIKLPVDDGRQQMEEHGQIVTDPITQRDITIVDAKYAPPPHISRSKPPIEPVSAPLFELYLDDLRRLTLKYIAFVVLAFSIILTLQQSIIWSILLAGGGAITWWKRVNSSWENLMADEQRVRSKQRMKIQGHEGDESVEWLNGAIASLWPQINTDIFASVIDILEDVMQASVPKIVHNVRIEDLGLGTNPVQLLSIRWLDESKEDERVPDDGEGALDVGEEPDEVSDSVGEWISLEGAFMYRALPSGAHAASKAKNVHLLINVWAGFKNVIATPIPIWAELKGATGVCRIKMQIIPDPPFVKHLTFSFMGMPKIELAAVPLNQHLVDVMNLPLISDFINSAINTAAREYVAPRSHTLDMYKIIRGEDSKKELDGIGVIVVHVKLAKNIIASDINGSSDCYVTLAYSKYNKPLWSSRIIFEDLFPIWDEWAVLLVNADELRAKEKLRVDLWDSDRFTVDDVLGHTEIDVTELVENRGKQYDREDLLHRFDDKLGHGTIEYSAVFYGQAELNQALATEGADERVAPHLRHVHPSLRPKRKPRDKSTPVSEEQVLYIPPDPALPSGVISIQVHNIVHLASMEVKSTKRREAHPSTTEEEEEGESLPSSYVSIILDDQKIYKTRVKPLSSKPFFNAGTERFVRDWRSCSVLVVVKDSRLRETDPILGVVELKLVDQLRTSSMVSRWFNMQGGIGYGKIRISILFRSIDTALPRTLQSADVASVEIVSAISSAHIADELVKNADYLAFKTPLVKKKAHRKGDMWIPEHNRGFRLGLRHRHASPCIITFRHAHKLMPGRTLAIAVFWLKDVVDEELVTLTLKVMKPHNVDRFEQNYLTEDHLEGESVGTIDVVVRVHRGVGHSHRTAGAKEHNFADVIAARECLGSIRGGVYETQTDSSENDSDDMTKTAKQREARKEQHMRERGVMQYKGARTAKWLGHEVKGAGRGLKGLFEHHGGRRKEVDKVESEV